jgi:hypothetical protein
VVHIPIPFSSIGNAFRRAATYFRSGAAVEGRAWLFDIVHPQILFGESPDVLRYRRLRQAIGREE